MRTRRRGPDTDYRVIRVGAGRSRAALSSIDQSAPPDCQRLHVEPGQVVHAATSIAGNLADGEQVTHAAEVDPEWIVALTGEDLDPVSNFGDGRIRQGIVVRGRCRTDIGGAS